MTPSLYFSRRAAGLCGGCGNAPPAPLRAQCGACLAKQRDYQRHAYRVRVAAGMCARGCGERAARGVVTCGGCREVKNYKRRELRRERRAA
jgi:hypothetical protein